MNFKLDDFLSTNRALVVTNGDENSTIEFLDYLHQLGYRWCGDVPAPIERISHYLKMYGSNLCLKFTYNSYLFCPKGDYGNLNIFDIHDLIETKPIDLDKIESVMF